MRKKLKIMLLIVIIIFNAGITFSYWVSDILSNGSNVSGEIPIGKWIPPGFVGVTQNGSGETITLSQIGSNDYPLNGNYILLENINLGGNNFTPIGGNNAFSGQFLGDGYSISNFNIVGTTENIGLFAANTGTISEVVLSNVTINLSGQSTRRAGLLVGYNMGLISFSRVAGSVFVLSSGSNRTVTTFVGGVTGYNSGTITHTLSTANIEGRATSSAGWFQSATSRSYAGGLVGYNTQIIEYSYSTGTVLSNATATNSGWFSSSARESYAGGLVGYSLNATIRYSFSVGNTESQVNTGSNNFVGRITSRGIVTQSYYQSTQGISGNLYNDQSISASQTELTTESFLTQSNTLNWISSNWIFNSPNYPIPNF